MADAGAGVPGSTVVTTMARNGTEFGIRVAGTGDRWFTAPAAVPDGLYLGGYGPDDANPDIGDSAITETVGLGGFAMAGAPAIVQLVGGQVDDARRWTELMYQITLAEHPMWTLPTLGLPGRAVRHRRAAGRAHRRRARSSTPAWPAGWPAPARSAPASSARRWPASPPPSTPWPPRGAREAAAVRLPPAGRPSTRPPALLAELGERGAKVLAGGQSLVPLLNFRLAQPEHLVDVNRWPGSTACAVGGGAVVVGAHGAARPAAARPGGGRRPPAAGRGRRAGSPTRVIRNRGTVGGSLAHADPAAELPAVLAVLGGSVEAVAWRAGARRRPARVAAAELFDGPLETTLERRRAGGGGPFPPLAPARGGRSRSWPAATATTPSPAWR